MLRAAGLALAAAALLAGAIALDEDHGFTPPARAGTSARIEHFTVRSPYVPGTHRETLIVPRAWRRGGPLLLWLHARGSDENSLVTPSFLRALRRAGGRAPAVLIPSDNRFSFWHDRRGHAWARYLMNSVLPRGLAISGANANRVAVGGISMGGFGAYDLARLHPGRFCAVGGHSAALYREGQPRVRWSFDDAADFARNDLLAIARTDPGAFEAPRLWLDVGTRDNFAKADTLFASRLEAAGLNVSFHLWPGRHSPSYWHAHFAAYVRFYADALAACRPAAR